MIQGVGTQKIQNAGEPEKTTLAKNNHKIHKQWRLLKFCTIWTSNYKVIRITILNVADLKNKYEDENT